MYAIIEDSGTQIRVENGDIVEVDLRTLEGDPAGQSLTFDRVLMVGGAGKSPTIGTPYVAGASVKAEVVDEVRGDKIDVIKYKRRKGYRRKQGHRQRYLRVKIDSISV